MQLWIWPLIVLGIFIIGGVIGWLIYLAIRKIGNKECK